MKNKAFLILAATIMALSMLTSCSGGVQTTDTPSTITVAETTTEETTAATTEDKKNSNTPAYISAYKAYLIDYYEDDQLYPFYGQFSLHYLDDDDVPELFISEGDFHHASVIILTFDGKEVKEITRCGTFGVIGFEERKGFIVEVTTGKSHVYSEIYKYENGELTEYWSGTYKYPGYPEPDSEEYYASNHQFVDKATYERDVEKYMPDVIKCNRKNYDAKEFPTKTFVIDGKEYDICTENIEKYLK